MATQIYSNSKELTYSASSYGYTYDFALKITRDTQNVTGNYTPVTATCSLTSPQSRWNTNASYGQLSVILYWLKSDGTYASKTFTGDKINQSAYNTTYSVSVSQNVPHLNDGTSKVYAIGKWYSSANNSYRPASTSMTSSTIALPTIPRASEITATSGYIGEAVSVYISRKSTSFTETLTWSCGDLSGTIPNESNATTVPFTIPTSLYKLIPNDKSVVVTITADTYNDSTKVGTKTTTLTARVDETANTPTVNTPVITETNTKVSALTDKLVLNASKPKVTITATAKNSATIKSIVTTNDDGQSLTGASVTFKEIGKAKFITTVTDSRGLITTKTVDQSSTAIPYVKPNIKTISIERESPVSGVLIFNATGSFYSGAIGSKTNSLTISYRYKENTTEATWSNLLDIPNSAITFDATNKTYKVTDYDLGEITEYNKNYIFEIYYGDILLDDATPLTRTVRKGVDVFSLGEHDAKVNGNLFVADEDGLNKVNVLEKIKDTGWIQATLSSGFATYSTGYEPIYRKIGKLVELQGVVKPTSALTNGGNETTILNLPVGYRPKRGQQFVCQGSGNNRWLLTVNTGGTVNISRYGTTSFIEVPSGAWLPFNVVYMVD